MLVRIWQTETMKAQDIQNH